MRPPITSSIRTLDQRAPVDEADCGGAESSDTAAPPPAGLTMAGGSRWSHNRIAAGRNPQLRAVTVLSTGAVSDANLDRSSAASTTPLAWLAAAADEYDRVRQRSSEAMGGPGSRRATAVLAYERHRVGRGAATCRCCSALLKRQAACRARAPRRTGPAPVYARPCSGRGVDTSAFDRTGDETDPDTIPFD